jgi:hypothetical protein
MRALLICGFVGFFAGACGGTLNRQPVPPADKLRVEDCEPALAVYRQLLALPAHAGTVVTGREGGVASPEEQEQAATQFAGQCHYQLAGRARRAILACWTDSADLATFRRCNEKF